MDSSRAGLQTLQGVMVVERSGADAFLAEVAPSMVALLDAGLRGDRAAALRLGQRLRQELADGALGRDLSDDLVERLDLVIEGFRRRQAEAPGVVGDKAARPARCDVLVQLHNAGTIDDAEFLAGIELRKAAEDLDTAGARVVDPTRPVVDGGKLWSEPELAGGGAVWSPATARALRWANYVRASAEALKGKRGRCGVLELVHRFVVQNVPAAELDRSLGVRKGTAARCVSAALRLHVAVNASPATKSA